MNSVMCSPTGVTPSVAPSPGAVFEFAHVQRSEIDVLRDPDPQIRGAAERRFQFTQQRTRYKRPQRRELPRRLARFEPGGNFPGERPLGLAFRVGVRLETDGVDGGLKP